MEVNESVKQQKEPGSWATRRNKERGGTGPPRVTAVRAQRCIPVAQSAERVPYKGVVLG